ncbi:4a-hydroxytetrahydrobiopterin dehydratase [Paenibacillus contaminans]|uniref:Putative pterin-4-alpha-carbinolamine dehydratase n=1 Tax=Paenibacillus contaminans TaxID=450362 RepID=A0A329MPC9_9BACL|nr:4a-hydroxytetrahydrobiopterin dehydratase [Paenibacillus contaminans]RAV21735.1 4a-hydroxytetrahydrobiopterin dehydratase [Paenibacillus contaminans]
MSKLSAEQIAVYLRKLQSWKFENSALHKTYRLPSFAASIRFVQQIAAAAESANHHPDLYIRSDRVTVSLTTHDANGVTGKDFSLAQQIDSISSSL